ncbi:MAG: hypothetical protein ABGZ35_03215, partial [Planctomycetaceae bacterium]
LVPPGDANSLASALLKFVCDRETAEEFGSAGRERATRLFSQTECVDSFLDLYGKLLCNDQPRAGEAKDGYALG